MRPQGVAEAFASLCPDVNPDWVGLPGDTRPEPPDAGYMSLQDMVITGLEGGYPWFLVQVYQPDHETIWAKVTEDDPEDDTVYLLDRNTMRLGLIKYIDQRIERGHPLHGILHNLEDLDLNDCDTVLQFATWGEVRYA